jgi:phasin
MSNDKKDTESPSAARDFAEKALGQAHSAVNTLLETAHKAAETIQTTAKTSESAPGQAVSKGFDFARQNIGAIFEFAQQIVRAPDLKEAGKLQSDFVKAQAATMEKQVKELQELIPAKTSDERQGGTS